VKGRIKGWDGENRFQKRESRGESGEKEQRKKIQEARINIVSYQTE